MMKRIFFILMLGAQFTTAQQKEVAITIDDIPNVMLVRKNNFSSLLLKRIDSLSLPVTVFINENNIQKNPFVKENQEVLKAWLNNRHITAGNHSFSHLNYADTSLQVFEDEVVKGEMLTRKILAPLGKSLVYFHFPYNSLGANEKSHRQVEQFLNQRGYTIAPFTIESEDWMYNALYEEARKNNDHAQAQNIGQEYVAFTLKLFDFFEQLCLQRFGRSIRQIYICHDNAINTDYLPMLLEQLIKKQYTFISLQEALRDKIYQTHDTYFGRAGISWIYRWEPDGAKRKALLQAEPEKLYNKYKKLTSGK